ncbi:MAG: phytanoyl-CoA dioxygenase family protein [Lentisphaeria bacterium]|nr:phytanoyl-CoA dioxygenase family protein [Lentisphaeria bacterium]NQZ69498.1 phytanoyl-CoA dioxygenase family protein [Lentisphaeria bacterium]
MNFTDDEKQFYYENGYIKIPQAVPVPMIDKALGLINHDLGQHGMNEEDLPRHRAQSYCNAIQSDPIMTDLFNESSLFSLSESLLGKNKSHKAGSAQIALRFPAHPSKNPSTNNISGHIDGIGTGANGLEVGSFRRGFTALCVVLLNDMPDENSGNFTVWPKTHHQVYDYIKEHGEDILKEGVPNITPMEGAKHITGKAGDAVFAHFLTFHTAAQNFSSNIRYAAIFRVRSSMIDDIKGDARFEPWLEYDGVRKAVNI